MPVCGLAVVMEQLTEVSSPYGLRLLTKRDEWRKKKLKLVNQTMGWRRITSIGTADIVISVSIRFWRISDHAEI